MKVYVDTKDAMGANMLNTILEAITAHLKTNSLKKILMSILSNHATASVVKVQGEIDVNDLNRGERSGEEVAHRMERASVLAQVDIHRAATHNKGVMNGIHAVVLATGNDTRGAEASAHAYASRDGQYRGIATWKYDKERGKLIGTIEVPMTLAIVGGGTKVLPIAKASPRFTQCSVSPRVRSCCSCSWFSSKLFSLSCACIRRYTARTYELTI